MSAVSETCSQPTCGTLDKPTSSLASGDGPTRSGSRGGQMALRFGPVPVPASPGVSPDAEGGLPTNAISGPNGSGSSESANLQSSLGNRLRALMGCDGSMVFRLTWKVRATPSGRPICALRASGRRTSGSGSTSWPTPSASDGNGGKGPCIGVSATGRMPDGRKVQMPLPTTAKLVLASWPTPTSALADKGVRSLQGAIIETARTRGPDLAACAALASWATPTARDWRDGRASPETMARNARPLNEQVVSGMGPIGCPASTDGPAQLNPAHSRWLMGFPPEWDACAPTATPSCRKSRRRSSKPT